LWNDAPAYGPVRPAARRRGMSSKAEALRWGCRNAPKIQGQVALAIYKDGLAVYVGPPPTVGVAK